MTLGQFSQTRFDGPPRRTHGSVSRVRRLLLATALIVSACASAGRAIDPKRAAQIEDGKTSRRQIEAWFGVPDDQQAVAKNQDGVVLRYVYSWVHASVVGASAGALVVDFNAEDVVVVSAYSEQ